MREKLKVAYQGPCADGETRGSLANSAVSRSDDSIGVQERTTAEVRAALLQTDDEGEVTGIGSGSTNNLRTHGAELAGRDGRTEDSSRNRKRGQERLDGHGEICKSSRR